MSGTLARIQTLAECRDISLVGGKAVNLGKLIRAEFPVPGGFVVTTHAYKLSAAEKGADGHPRMSADLVEEIRAAYRAMGEGGVGGEGLPTVAVRSSATAEDMADASMAGQYETYLNIEGERALLEAIGKCWASLDAPRTRAYFAEHGIDSSHVAMAVVVQRLVPAEVAGVLFTVNPNRVGAGVGGEEAAGGGEMLVEASWGLGESVVSGRVQPDVLRINQATGKLIDASIANKEIQLAPGKMEEEAVEESRRKLPCLSDGDVKRLWELGRKVHRHFESPQDLEWAIHGGAVYLLQSRPITTLTGSQAYQMVLRATVEQLRHEMAGGRGPWALHNLAETVPHPAPLTWSVLKRFMSGAGGFGAMYRAAGFEPSALVTREGFLDRIAGRIYMDAARAPEMFFGGFPFAYDHNELRSSPDASQVPPTVPTGSIGARFKMGRRLSKVDGALRERAKTWDGYLRGTLFREIEKFVSEARGVDLTHVDVPGLVGMWNRYESQVMGKYGAELLLPSLISGMALEDLRTFLAEQLWEQDADALAQLLSSGGPANQTVVADGELYEVGMGKRTVEQWVKDHGHRGAGEFDLSAARWREEPEAVREMAGRLAGSGSENPLVRHERHANEIQGRVDAVWKQLPEDARGEFKERLELLRRYLPFREDAKDYLMRGYELLRLIALEAGRRLHVGQDIFYLTREELFDALRVGVAPVHVIEQRKLEYAAEAKIDVPRFIGAKEIETLGMGHRARQQAEGNGAYRAFAVSGGQATGKVRILKSPVGAPDLGRGYILVCPSTDPSWTPLFVNAAGLVLERGGTLSHGALVAREMGLPAVVLADATEILKEGEELRIDGTGGWIERPSEVVAYRGPVAVDPNDTMIGHELIPPPPGPKDKTAATWRNRLALVWGVYLLAFFALPEKWVHDPTLAVLDALLWPLVRVAGKPGTVAIIAAGIAVLTLVIQKMCTDNRRLLLAKERAGKLNREAATLPKGSPRRNTLVRLAAPVQMRTLMAAMVPVGMLLGPLVMPFAWFKDRLDTSVWSAPAGSAVQIVASVDSEWNKPVQVEVPAPMTVDEATPAVRTIEPIRPTLERLMALYKQPAPAGAGEPWELKIAPDVGRRHTAENLQAYLDKGVPPRGISWTVRAPEDLAGKFPVKVTAAGSEPVTVEVVLGEKDPPAPRIVAGNGKDSPLREVKAVYPGAGLAQVFWRPVKWLKVGWLMLYIVAYLPALFLTRLLLRVA